MIVIVIIMKYILMPPPPLPGDESYARYAQVSYAMVPLLHTHQRRKQLGVVASCDIRQWEARSCQ
jgi:hypothetical protein